MEPGDTGTADTLFDLPMVAGAPIGRRLTLLDGDGQRAVFFGTVAINVFDRGDKASETACMAMLSRAGLASDVDIARAFGHHRNTVRRHAARLAAGGMAAVVPAKRGPRGPSKVTPAVMKIVEGEGAGLGPSALARLIAKRTGVVLSAVHAGRLKAATGPVQPELPEPAEVEPAEVEPAEVEPAGVEPAGVEPAGVEPAGVEGGQTGSDADAAGMVKGDHAVAEAAAAGGVGFDPPVVLPTRVRGRYMGLALYYPALAALGLVEVARSVFCLPRSERFGVRAVTLTLFFMTLLSKTTVEAAKHLRRAAFGAVVGSGRAPAVKTLRRKLAELVTQGRAGDFGTGLARRWVEAGMVATAYLHVDGHMSAYAGKRRLAKVWNSQRRMPLPGVHTYHVADSDGRPLLFLTEELSTNLAKAMPRIIEAVRDAVGDRAFTVIFDRGGYDGKLFTWLTAQGIGFITYQRGNPGLPDDAFARREARFEGRRTRFWIAEDDVKVASSGPWRRVVVRTRDGHQTPILTNLGTDRLGAARVACLAFARWRHENIFKYMGEHHGLDRLVSYAAGPAPAGTTVPNPERKRLDRQIAERRKHLAALKASLGDALLDEPKTGSRSAHGLKIAQRGAVRELRELEADIDTLAAARKAQPTHVSVGEAGTEREVMRLEAKAIVDRIKISAYNAEEWMLDRLVRHYPNPHDARDLLRSFAELSGEIRTTDTGVTVTLDPPDTPIHRRALHGLLDELNTSGAAYPGTDIPVTYQVAMHHSEAVA